jgi:hypothetical protein
VHGGWARLCVFALKQNTTLGLDLWDARCLLAAGSVGGYYLKRRTCAREADVGAAVE